jgi:hypothetical protein
LLALRRAWRSAAPDDSVSTELLGDATSPTTLVVRAASGQLELWANLSGERASLPERGAQSHRLLLSTADSKYGGARSSLADVTELLPHELLVWGPAAWL